MRSLLPMHESPATNVAHDAGRSPRRLRADFDFDARGAAAGPQLLQGPGAPPQRSLQTAKPVLYVLPDCLYTIPAGKPCSGPASPACSIPGQCTDAQLPGGCCQVGFTCTCAGGCPPGSRTASSRTALTCSFGVICGRSRALDGSDAGKKSLRDLQNVCLCQ